MYKPYKILTLVTSMEYGGAETHILELSKYFKLNGIEVKIISNGGSLFEKEIGGADIEHIYAPFHSRSISDMAKAAKILKREINTYKPDVVHSHSRIPAFVAAGVCKKLKIPLVTTIHGTYKQSLLLKFATNWGDYSLYVSDDVKEYWQKYYNIKNGYMTKTVNGINTGLFNAGEDSDIKREFGIKPEEKIILTVSRLDSLSSFSARKLCEIAEDIYGRDKNTRIIIVGDGEIFGGIKSMADKINAKLGFNYIILTGGRTDVYKFCKACEIFIGISRAALEAAACSKNVIMCGDMGYLGRLTEENAGKCESSNFTCRNFGYPEDINGALLNEILFCLNPRNKETLETAAKFGAELIYQKYSVKKMADDACSVYQKAVRKYGDYDFVLSGYYGYGNIGDDALLFTVISNISEKKRDVKICLLTKNPKKLQKRLDNYFPNITAKPRFNLPGIKNSLKKSKALVFGGGTFLNDNTSTRSFLYYLTLLKMAQKLGKKTILYANGIGPIYSKKNQAKAAETVKNITLATLRDEESYNYLSGMEMNKENLRLTADEAITIRRNGYLNAYKKDFKEFILRANPGGGNYIAVCVRKWKYLNADFFGKFSAAIDVICRENGFIPVYIVMQPQNDRAVSERLSALHGRAYLADVGGDIEKTLAVIRTAEAVISMRLHSLVFAAAFGIPMIGVSYDPKVRNFLNSIFENGDYTVELKDFSKDMLVEKFRNLMSNKEKVKDKINGAAERLCGQAAMNAELFVKAMYGENTEEGTED